MLWAAPAGGFSALNPETGTTSEGETQAEALRNLAGRGSHPGAGAPRVRRLCGATAWNDVFGIGRATMAEPKRRRM